MKSKSPLARRLVLGLAGSLALAASALGAAATASAASYGSTSYVSGIVCTTASSTPGTTPTGSTQAAPPTQTQTQVPLVSYDFGVGVTPGFLTTGITSTNGSNSAQLPFGGALADSSLSSSTQATVAALIRMYGSGTPQQVGEVADLIQQLSTNDHSSDSCLNSGTGGISGGDAQALLANATAAAAPVVSAGFQNSTLLHSGTTSPVAKLTGVDGHSGTISFAVYGPINFTAGSACASITPAQWSAAIADKTKPIGTQTSTAPFAGDGTIQGAPVTLDAAGCYAVTAAATTSNAVPNVTARSGVSTNQSALTVLDTAAKITVASAGVVRPGGTSTASIAITGTHGGTGTLHTVVANYPTVYHHDCSSLDWSSAPSYTTLPDQHVSGDRAYVVALPGKAAAGCYRYSSSLTVDLPGLPGAQVPVSGPNTVAAVAPHIVVDSDTVTHSGLAPGQIISKVSVGGTLGRKATIASRVLESSAAECDGTTDWRHAATVSTSAAVPLDADQEVTLTSATLPKTGCYTVVPVISFTGSSVTVTGAPGGSINIATLQAPPPVYKPLFAPTPPTKDGVATKTLLEVIGGAGVLLSLAVGVIAFLRRHDDGDVPGFDGLAGTPTPPLPPTPPAAALPPRESVLSR